jgi:putative membrane protein
LPRTSCASHILLSGSPYLFEKGVVRWRGVVALLVTGKFSCLLAVRATPPLYADDHAGPGHLAADQRLAGLLMLIVCPFCYGLAWIAIAAKWLQELA